MAESKGHCLKAFSKQWPYLVKAMASMELASLWAFSSVWIRTLEKSAPSLSRCYHESSTPGFDHWKCLFLGTRLSLLFRIEL